MEEKKRVVMVKGLIFIVITGGIMAIYFTIKTHVGGSTKPLNPNNVNSVKFHKNKNINKILQFFSTATAEKLVDVSEPNSTRQYIGDLRNAEIKISSKSKKIFIYIGNELRKEEYHLIRFYVDILLEWLVPGIEEKILDDIHQKLCSGRYQYFDNVEAGKLELGLKMHNLNDGCIRYKFNIEIPIKVLKQKSVE